MQQHIPYDIQVFVYECQIYINHTYSNDDILAGWYNFPTYNHCMRLSYAVLACLYRLYHLSVLLLFSFLLCVFVLCFLLCVFLLCVFLLYVFCYMYFR